MSNDKQGYVVGTIDGRVHVEYFDQQNKNFAFKCHRNNSNVNVFAVNDIAFVPNEKGVFITCGSDGIFSAWDLDTRSRLYQSPQLTGTISCIKCSPDGTKIARAMSYDWSQGKHFKDSVKNNQICVSSAQWKKKKNKF